MKEDQKIKGFQKFLYLFAKNATFLLFKIVWRLEIVGKENVPLNGGVLLASNHVSYADPPLVAASVDRFIHFFAKEELFHMPVIGWFISQVNAFPVKRFEHDIGAFKKAQKLLTQGEAVVLFPEGRRSKTGELGKAKAGVGMLSLKTGVPVVPIYISNSYKIFSFKKIKVFIGKPIKAPEVENQKLYYQSFSEQVLSSIAELKSRMMI
ncbi:MAG: 1-acyl-sn-glycerol-3-phosphate acyltransferase [Elusimicrobia bacterium]|nr:1-acyl-sn-glycerol-3-phosphate acyltransferase [Elusimicrobiota bacterium]